MIYSVSKILSDLQRSYKINPVTTLSSVIIAGSACSSVFLAAKQKWYFSLASLLVTGTVFAGKQIFERKYSQEQKNSHADTDPASRLKENYSPLLKAEVVEKEVPKAVLRGSFKIQGNPAHQNGPQFPLSIGDASSIGVLKEENFGQLCDIINQETLTPLYPTGLSRANHNGTHSARQARMLEALFELIEVKAQPHAKQQLQALTGEEKMHLKLAAYLLRSGRIDESCHTEANPDDYYTRSALIYEAYARQLQASEPTISWIKKQLINSCKPAGIRDASIDQSPKDLFAWNCLTSVHELDLIRCFSQSEIDGRIKPNLQARLAKIFPGKEPEITNHLIQFSKNLCQATGSHRAYDYHGGNKTLFTECSLSGKRCWEAVKSQKLNSALPSRL